MTQFLLLYRGPATPPDASHAGWPQWFAKLGEKLVDLGSPTTNGVVVRSGGQTSGDAAPVNGYSIIAADDRAAALDLVQNHPLLALDGEYTIEVFELPNK